uniref:DUF7512 family protein n=1 Tax=Natronorubrum halophilum TaxID=1702106 RepID=UPI000EF6A8C9|nr:hypothetical protein [Natronorubrum halophilum]
MNDRNVELPAFGRQLATVLVVLLSTTVVALSVPLIAPVFGESGEAAATVGYILAEALVLYVGYGALTRVTSPAARELLVNT